MWESTAVTLLNTFPHIHESSHWVRLKIFDRTAAGSSTKVLVLEYRVTLALAGRGIVREGTHGDSRAANVSRGFGQRARALAALQYVSPCLALSVCLPSLVRCSTNESARVCAFATHHMIYGCVSSAFAPGAGATRASRTSLKP